MACQRVRSFPWDKLHQVNGGSIKNAISRAPGWLEMSLDQLIANQQRPESLYLADYEYGQLIVKDGQFQPPCSDPRCAGCQELLQAVRGVGARPGPEIPLSFVVQGCAEVFVKHPLEDEQDSPAAREELASMLLPLNVIEHGVPFGVFETLNYRLGLPNERANWQVSAGIRSIYVLAPLDNEGLIESLTRRPGPGGKSIHHWELVSRTLEEQNSSRWTATVLVLPRTLLDAISFERAPVLQERLLEIGWQQSAALRMSGTRDGIYLRKLRPALDNENLEVGQLYYYFTLRHCMNMLQGQRPAMVPVGATSDPGGPFEPFRARLSEELQRRRLAFDPVIMRPGFLGTDGVQRGYYSMRIPTAPGLDSGIGSRSRKPVYKNLLTDLERIVSNSEDDELKQLFRDRIRGFIQRPRRPVNNRSGALQNWMVYSDELPAQDFRDGNQESRIFWNSPFFVAGLTLAASSAQASANF
jgi:hypothetical protein